MYLRSQLDRFADQIQDAEQARQFRTIVDSISFDTKGLCIGASLERFDGTAVDALRKDFEARHIEFLQQTDFDALIGKTE